MLNRSLIVFSFLIVALSLKSQDYIYLNNGSKFEAKVKEITSNEIKYKNINNPDGPTYVIAKSEVLFVEYKNGTVDVINKNPTPISPKPVTPTAGNNKPEAKKTPTDLYYMNKNTLLINGLALTNADITLMYDREFAKSHLSVTVLGGYNFNKQTTWPNLVIKDALSNTKKNYDVGLGLNFYPSTRRKSQYFMGIMVKYMNFNYDKEITVEETIGGFVYQKIEIQKANGYQLAGMFVNGFQVRLTPTITYKAFVGIGPYTGNSELLTNSGSLGITNKMYLGLCIGYRF